MNEILSLNDVALDIEQLEARVELGQIIPPWFEQPETSYCVVNCPSCLANCLSD